MGFSEIGIITHRFERLSAADEIWYLEDGRLKEVGSTQEVLGGNGPTAQFFKSRQVYLEVK